MRGIVIKVNQGGLRVPRSILLRKERLTLQGRAIARLIQQRQPPFLSVSASQTSFYKRSNFVTHLPVDCLYSPSHFWLRRIEGDRWRIGFTKFATRMLGEIVDVQFEKKPGDAVTSGEIIGSIEGFKAISDIYCVADGRFVTPNTTLAEDIEKIGKDPYNIGWLYELDGQPDAKCRDVESYRALLDATIDRMLTKQSNSETDEHP